MKKKARLKVDGVGHSKKKGSRKVPNAGQEAIGAETTQEMKGRGELKKPLRGGRVEWERAKGQYQKKRESQSRSDPPGIRKDTP